MISLDSETKLLASGFAGLAAGFALELYRQLLLDPVLLGVQQPADWVASARLLFLFGSVAVLFYAGTVSNIDEGWRDLFVNAALLAQWGAPLTLALAALFGPGSPAGFLTLVLTALHAVVASTVAVSRVRST